MEDRAEIVTYDSKTDKPISFIQAAKATFETIRFFARNRSNFPPEAAVQLAGLKVAFPDRLTNKSLSTDPNLNFFKHIAYLGIKVNDAVDMNPAYRRAGKQEVVEQISGYWKQALRAAHAAAEGIPEREIIVRDYQRETLAMEKFAREMPSTAWSLGVALRYKELVNAIGIACHAAALLGSNMLSQRLVSIGKNELTWQALEQKYAWMINGRPANEAERKLCGLFNIVMSTQAIDDWYDLRIDQRLGLHTIATEVMKSGDKDNKKGWQEIQSITQKYYQNANQFGFTGGLTKGADLTMRLLKEGMQILPNVVGGQRERVDAKAI